MASFSLLALAFSAPPLSPYRRSALRLTRPTLFGDSKLVDVSIDLRSPKAGKDITLKVVAGIGERTTVSK